MEAMGETGEVDTAGREDDAFSVLGKVTWVVGAGGEVGVFGELTSGGGRLGGGCWGGRIWDSSVRVGAGVLSAVGECVGSGFCMG